MNPHQRLLTLALCAALTIGLMPAADAAANIRVKLPSFTVTLCGQTIDPTKEEYPFLVYGDITYLPLTYFGCRLLGLYAKWSPETGLTVSDAGAKGAYQSTPRVSRNSGTLYAQKAAGEITINNKWIENNKENYPFLLFRDVTYLPMTWANMHDLLGCDYRWDAKNGLVIDRATDANASALYLPIYRDAEGSFVGSIAAWKGWFWYQDDTGRISRAPMAGGEREQLIELPKNDWNDTPVLASLAVRDGSLYMTYHLGGATMGHDEQFRFNEDGSYAALVKANGPVGELGNLWLHANCQLQATQNNLFLSRDKGGTWERFGDESFIYGWTFRGSAQGGWSASYGADGAIYRVGSYAYLLGTDAAGWDGMKPDGNGNYPELFSKVCRVDLTSGETEAISQPARVFRLVGETVWYITFDGELRHCALDGSRDAAVAFDGIARADYTELDKAAVKSLAADNERVYIELAAPFHVQGGAGVEPHTEDMTCLAALDGDGSGGAIALYNCGNVRSMTAEDGCLTLLTERSNGEMSLFVLRDGRIVYQNKGPDYLAAGVSGGKLYYVLR